MPNARIWRPHSDSFRQRYVIIVEINDKMKELLEKKEEHFDVYAGLTSYFSMLGARCAYLEPAVRQRSRALSSLASDL